MLLGAAHPPPSSPTSPARCWWKEWGHSPSARFCGTRHEAVIGQSCTAQYDRRNGMIGFGEAPCRQLGREAEMQLQNCGPGVAGT